MLFNLIFFILFAAVAYFHYAQGLFSAAISAILCVVAALLAVGYHEMLTPYLMKLPDVAEAVSLVGIFVLAYVIPRLIFDNLIPGNVRYPLLMDKIGAGVMGVVAGLFASGVLAVAAQTMPFGPAIAGFSRQELQDRPNVVVPGNAVSGGRALDSSVTDELVGDRLGDPSHQSRMWLHQDDLVIGLAAQLSNPGSAMAGDLPLAAAHPDYLNELFAQRLGLPVGAKRLAVNSANASAASVSGAYTLAKLAPAMILDSELSAVRGDQPLPEVPGDPSNVMVVVRVAFSSSPDLTDTDGRLRLGPANVRLKAGANDYYPVGTLVGGQLLLRNRPDDPMVIEFKGATQSVDFLFLVSTDDLNAQSDGKEKHISFKQGSFLEVKRYAQSDISGMDLAAGAPGASIESADLASTGTLGGVLRKGPVAEAAMKALGGSMPSGSASRAGRQGRGNSSSGGTPNNSNDLLPNLPNHLMGL